MLKNRINDNTEDHYKLLRTIFGSKKLYNALESVYMKAMKNNLWFKEEDLDMNKFNIALERISERQKRYKSSYITHILRLAYTETFKEEYINL